MTNSYDNAFHVSPYLTSILESDQILFRIYYDVGGSQIVQ